MIKDLIDPLVFDKIRNPLIEREKTTYLLDERIGNLLRFCEKKQTK